MGKIDEWAIQKEFRTKLITVSSIPGTGDRAWENSPFSPTEDTPWIRETFLPGGERRSANGELEQVGVMEYDYFVPVGHSISAARGVVKDVKQAFEPNSVLGGLVIITDSSVLTVGKDSGGAWYQLKTQIGYRVHGTT